MLFSVEEIRQIYSLLQEYPESDEVSVVTDFVQDQLVLVAYFMLDGETLGCITIGAA